MRAVVFAAAISSAAASSFKLPIRNSSLSANVFIAQESGFCWPGGEQTVTPRVWAGQFKPDKIVLESSPLTPWLLISINGSCPGTSPGADIIRCEWDNAEAASGLSFKLKYGGTICDRSPMLNFTLTSFVTDDQSGTMMELGACVALWWKPGTAWWQTDQSVFPQPRSMNVSALPDTYDELHRLKQLFPWADFQPTGFYLLPERPMKVTISGLRQRWPRPEILVGTPSLINPENQDTDTKSALKPSGPLANGEHIVSTRHGGIIYVRYVYAAKNNKPPSPVTVTLDADPAVQPFPYFRSGITTNREWLQMLRETRVPFAEHLGERVIITGLADEALEYAELGQSQEGLSKTYTDIMKAQDAISGLDAYALSRRDRPSPLKPMVVHGNRKRYADTFSYRSAFGMGRVSDVWYEPLLRRSWKIWHELGHFREHAWSWSWSELNEVTVNIYTLAARRAFFPQVDDDDGVEHPAAHEWKEAKAYLARDVDDKCFEHENYFTRLVMLEQLRVVFGDGFYHELHRRSRALDDFFATDEERKRYFMTQASEISSTNLTPFFTKWGLEPDELTKEVMSRQPDAASDLTTTSVYGGD